MTTIAIIGGGLSGSILLINLLKQQASSLKVVLIEKNESLGPGVAYSTQEPLHLLNVPVRKMSLFIDDPDHFFNWFASKGIDVSHNDFVQRGLYGKYVEKVLNKAIQEAKKGNITLEIIQDEAMEIAENGNEAIIKLKRGKTITSNVVVLALGNAVPGSPFELNS